jgi:hypothetical protein
MDDNNSNFYKSTTTRKIVVTKNSSASTTSSTSSSTVVHNPYNVKPKTKQTLQIEAAPEEVILETDDDKHQDDENSYEEDQYIPIGKKRRVGLEDEEDNTVHTVMPRVKVVHKHSPNDGNNIGYSVDEADTWYTVVPVPDYTNFVTDIEYINKKHEIINGKLDEWRKATMRLLDRVENDPVMGNIYDQDCFGNQRKWVSVKVAAIMLGISEFTKLPIDLLRREALIQLVPGIDNKEQADFVYRIASSQHFELAVEPMRNKNDFTIDTIFDEQVRRTYGKTYD